MAALISSPIAQALEDSINFFRQKEKNSTLGVKEKQVEFEQQLVSDVANSISPTYDRTGKAIATTASTMTIKV
jgi:hypothetical protein